MRITCACRQIGTANTRPGQKEVAQHRVVVVASTMAQVCSGPYVPHKQQGRIWEGGAQRWADFSALCRGHHLRDCLAFYWQHFHPTFRCERPQRAEEINARLVVPLAVLFVRQEPAHGPARKDRVETTKKSASAKDLPHAKACGSMLARPTARPIPSMACTAAPLRMHFSCRLHALGNSSPFSSHEPEAKLAVLVLRQIPVQKWSVPVAANHS